MDYYDCGGEADYILAEAQEQLRRVLSGDPAIRARYLYVDLFA